MGKIEGWQGDTGPTQTKQAEVKFNQQVTMQCVSGAASPHPSVTTPQLREASLATPNQLEVQDYNTAEVHGRGGQYQFNIHP